MSANNYQIKPNDFAPAIDKAFFDEAYRVFSIPSTTYNEKSMALFLCGELNRMNIPYYIDDYSNIIITKGKADLYPCFCAHMDTVHLYRTGFNIVYYEEKGRYYLHAVNNDKKPVGIGGDDKAGIFACLYLLKHVDNIKIVFFSQEESGGIGSSNIDVDFFKDCKFLGGIDRWNGKDFINNYMGQCTLSKSFKKAITEIIKKRGYSFNTGMFTDSFNVMQRDIDLSCFNVSCGYYSHHSNSEYQDLNELYNCCLLCVELCRLPNRYEHCYYKPIKKYKSKNWNSWSKKSDDKWEEHEINSSYQRDYSEYADIPVCVNCGIELLEHESVYCTPCKCFLSDDDFEELLK